MIRNKKPVLDEREMQEMYRIEHRGLRAMYVLLCAAVVLQLIFGANLVQLAGELFVIAVVGVGMMIAYARRGIWDEDARPSVQGNAVYAALSAVCVFAVMLLLGRGRHVLRAAAIGCAMFVLCFLLLTLIMRYMQRRQEKEAQGLETDED